MKKAERMSIIHVDGMDDEIWRDDAVTRIIRLYDLIGISIGVMIGGSLGVTANGHLVSGGVFMMLAWAAAIARPRIIRRFGQ